MWNLCMRVVFEYHVVMVEDLTRSVDVVNSNRTPIYTG